MAFDEARGCSRTLDFELSKATIYRGSEVHGRNPIALVTPAAQWAYALTAPLFPPEFDRRGGFRIKILALVHRGRIGIGILRCDESDFVQEITIDRSSTWRE